MNNENLSEPMESKNDLTSLNHKNYVFDNEERDELIEKPKSDEIIRFPSCPDRW